jgi:probable rRNA maturation factor
MPARVTTRNGPHPGINRASVRRWAERMLVAVALDRAELSILLTDDVQIRALNRCYRGEDRPTDVLAFCMREGLAGAARDGPPVEILGDVVISVPTAARQAKRARRTVEAEVRMLLGHGLLHLLGFDHGTSAERRIMRARTRSLCIAATRPRLPVKRQSDPQQRAG